MVTKNDDARNAVKNEAEKRKKLFRILPVQMIQRIAAALQDQAIEGDAIFPGSGGEFFKKFIGESDGARNIWALKVVFDAEHGGPPFPHHRPKPVTIL